MRNSTSKSLLALSMLAISTGAQAATSVETCTLDFQGNINALVDIDGELHAIAKLKGESDNKFTYGDSIERKGHLTTTFSLVFDDTNCGFSPTSVEPLASQDEGKPWKQFQMVQDQRREVTAQVSFEQDIPMFIADGRVPDSKLVRPFAFELDDGKWRPIKTEITKGNGSLPPAKVGNRSMSQNSDGGDWRYQLAEVSQDGRLLTASTFVNNPITFKNGDVLDKDTKFAVLWQVRRSCDVNKGACNNKTASTLTLEKSGKVITSEQIKRNPSNNAGGMGLGTFDQIIYDADATMAQVSSVIEVADDTYLLSGKSVSGKAMVAKVTFE